MNPRSWRVCCIQGGIQRGIERRQIYAFALSTCYVSYVNDHQKLSFVRNHHALNRMSYVLLGPSYTTPRSVRVDPGVQNSM